MKNKDTGKIIKILVLVSAAVVAAILAGVGIYGKIKNKDEDDYEEEDIFEDELADDELE